MTSTIRIRQWSKNRKKVTKIEIDTMYIYSEFAEVFFSYLNSTEYLISYDIAPEEKVRAIIGC